MLVRREDGAAARRTVMTRLNAPACGPWFHLESGQVRLSDADATHLRHLKRSKDQRWNTRNRPSWGR
jgi:hypothetical protein